MEKLPFVPYEEPLVDFFITTDDSEDIRKTLEGLGASRVEKAGYVAYVWNTRLTNEFISGFGVVAGGFEMGPRLRTAGPEEFGLGSYVYVRMDDDYAKILPDPFAMHRVYVEHSFVTNRLHLAAIVKKEIDVDNALSIFFDNSGFSYNYNTLQTAVKDVYSLQVGQYVEIKSEEIQVATRYDSQAQYETLSVDKYWSLIEAGADEITRNIEAIVASGLPVFADITGGKDSRIVFGGILAAHGIESVVFNTIPEPRNEILKADLEIGTGLVHEYGGSYRDRPRPIAYSVQNLTSALHRRRSQVFGFNFQIKSSDLMPWYQLTPTPTLRLLGGGGELYRDRWHNLKFSDEQLNVEFDREYAAKRLKIHANKTIGTRFFDKYLPYLLDTLEQLPGVTFGDKLDSHYLNFRTTTQFGVRERLPESLNGIALAVSENLLAAARGLPIEEKASGRIIFDVLRILDEKLPYFEFDNPMSEEILESPYHKKDSLDGQVLQLVPKPELAKEGFAASKHVRPVRPQATYPPIEEILNSEIDQSVEKLKEPGNIFHFLVEGGLEDYISESRAAGLTKISTCASKLRYLTDLADLADGSDTASIGHSEI